MYFGKQNGGGHRRLSRISLQPFLVGHLLTQFFDDTTLGSLKLGYFRLIFPHLLDNLSLQITLEYFKEMIHFLCVCPYVCQFDLIGYREWHALLRDKDDQDSENNIPYDRRDTASHINHIKYLHISTDIFELKFSWIHWIQWIYLGYVWNKMK